MNVVKLLGLRIVLSILRLMGFQPMGRFFYLDLVFLLYISPHYIIPHHPHLVKSYSRTRRTHGRIEIFCSSLGAIFFRAYRAFSFGNFLGKPIKLPVLAREPIALKKKKKRPTSVGSSIWAYEHIFICCGANTCSVIGGWLLFSPVSSRPANAANNDSFLPLSEVLPRRDCRTKVSIVDLAAKDSGDSASPHYPHNWV